MRTSTNGTALIKKYEGRRLKAYLCPAGVWTIGYGSTGPHVKRGMVITSAEADSLLRQDLIRFERGVLKAVMPQRPSQNEFDAMVSLAFNIGLGNFGKSSEVRQFKRGNRGAAANAFGMWIKARNPKTGRLQVLEGLVKRRAAEKQLFLSETGARLVSRNAGVGTPEVTVPESSVVPMAPKSLGASREVIGGGVVGTGGVLQLVNGFSADDAYEVKEGLNEVKYQDSSFVQKMHLPEIASVLVVILAMFIIWKRFSDRKEGIR